MHIKSSDPQLGLCGQSYLSILGFCIWALGHLAFTANRDVLGWVEDLYNGLLVRQKCKCVKENDSLGVFHLSIMVNAAIKNEMMYSVRDERWSASTGCIQNGSVVRCFQKGGLREYIKCMFASTQIEIVYEYPCLQMYLAKSILNEEKS